MNFYSNHSEMYNNMSIQFYNDYLNAKQRLFDLTDGNKAYDIGSHTSKEVTCYFYLSNRKGQMAIASIIFQALAIEAYSNSLCSYYLHIDEYCPEDNKKEHCSTLDKLVALSQCVYQKEFPKGDIFYARIKQLFKKRDKLVHKKSNSINTNDLKPTDNKDLKIVKFTEFMTDEYAFVYKNIDKEIKLYNLLRELYRKFDPDGKDVIDRARGDLFNTIQTEDEVIIHKVLRL